MRDTLLEGKFFKGVAKGTSAQSIQRLLCGEHRLIVVCIEIPSNDKPIYGRDFRSDEVADMRHQFPRFHLAVDLFATSMSRLGESRAYPCFALCFRAFLLGKVVWPSVSSRH